MEGGGVDLIVERTNTISLITKLNKEQACRSAAWHPAAICQQTVAHVPLPHPHRVRGHCESGSSCSMPATAATPRRLHRVQTISHGQISIRHHRGAAIIGGGAIVVLLQWCVLNMIALRHRRQPVAALRDLLSSIVAEHSDDGQRHAQAVDPRDWVSQYHKRDGDHEDPLRGAGHGVGERRH